ncbi:MAG: hypothetical protein JWN25_56 [Verrucomicrobiales bacterium]|nr:hypothetical protein [Verrucomicrobiales bacterium]
MQLGLVGGWLVCYEQFAPKGAWGEAALARDDFGRYMQSTKVVAYKKRAAHGSAA